MTRRVFHSLRRLSLVPRQMPQRGVSLVFALMALAALSLAAVALIRSIDSSTLVIGNLGFKQDATSGADRVAEAARAWLMDPSRDLTADVPAAGYYATAQDGLDVTGRLTTAANRLAVVNWGEPDSCACLSAGTCLSCNRTASPEVSLNGGALRGRYLITRMCPSTGAVSATNACAQPPNLAVNQSPARGEVRQGANFRPAVSVEVPFYRIVVRAVSGRNTVSYTETIVY